MSDEEKILRFSSNYSCQKLIERERTASLFIAADQLTKNSYIPVLPVGILNYFPRDYFCTLSQQSTVQLQEAPLVHTWAFQTAAPANPREWTLLHVDFVVPEQPAS